MSGGLDRRLRSAANGAGPLLLLFTWLKGDGGPLLLLALLIGMAGCEYGFRFLTGRRFTPYMAMALAPLLLVQYSSVVDFRVRLACFVMVIYVVAAAVYRPRRRLPVFPAHAAPWRVGLLCFTVFALTAVALYAQGIHLSGDEPHYVMIAQSLAEDGDFDLKNNLENKTYLSFIPVAIDFHGSIHEGRYRSYHLPGLSFLLLPFYLFFKLLGGLVPGPLYFRLAAAAIHVFFALGLYLLLRSTWPERDNGMPFLFFLVTFPLVFHSVHLYPELPAATLLIFAYLLSRGPRRKLFLAGSLLAGIPWLHFKYAIPLLLFVLFVMAGIWRDRADTHKMRNLIRFLIPQAISATLLALYSHTLYGSFNPTVISPEKHFFAIPLAAQIETLFSFFLDQRDGLLVYAPVFLLLLLVFKKKIRSQVGDFWPLTAIFLSYILSHAFTTVRGAYSPAARPTLFVVWIMAVFLIAFYRQAGEFGKSLFCFLAGLTAFASTWIFYYPFFLYQPVTRDVSERGASLLYFLGSRAVNLTSVFPSFLKKPNAEYLPNWIWLAALAIGFVLYYVRPLWRPPVPAKRGMMRPERDRANPGRLVFPVLGLLLLYSLCFFPHVQLQARYSQAGLAFYSNSRNFIFLRDLGRFQARAGQDYDLFIDPGGSTADRLDLRILNPKRIAVQVKNGKQALLAKNRDVESRVAIPLEALKKFSLGRKSLVHLGLESEARAGSDCIWLEFRR